MVSGSYRTMFREILDLAENRHWVVTHGGSSFFGENP